jgi:AcrR family transcriptional regulator
MTGNRQGPVRRVPQQVRSRDRVGRILEVAGELVVEHGVDAVTTRGIAARAGIPVASLYQYFADRDEILLALVARDSTEMDEQVAEDLGRLTVLSVAAVVETTMRAFAKVYQRRPTFVVLRTRGRTNPALRDHAREHNRRIARMLFELSRDRGMLLEDATGHRAELAVEICDRLFQLAFESSLQGDDQIIDEGIALLTHYLESHATPEGIAGIPD